MHARGRGVADHPIAAWHELVRSADAAALDALLDEGAVFHSPVVHTPQRGKKLVAAYLGAAFRVFGGTGFRYVREIIGPSDAVLEFEAEIDGIFVNGVDIIGWNGAGRIVDFKVMLRPLQAVDAVRRRMADALRSER